MRAAPVIIHVARLTDGDAHHAFTDLQRWRGRWYCVFREGRDHVGGNGHVRVLTSADGDVWTSAALIAEPGVDLRDPKLSVTPDDRLMLLAGGSVYDEGRPMTRQSRVAFSTDGCTWAPPVRVLEVGEWLWRVTWHDGRAYGVSYNASPAAGGDWTLTLVSSVDGVCFSPVTRLGVPGKANETTVRVMPDGQMVALVRREGGTRAAWMGRSQPPYTAWTWRETPCRVGGPNVLVLPDGTLWASGRHHGDCQTTVLARCDADGQYQPVLTLPSGGDTSYAGMVWHDGLLWMSYYSSHEQGTHVYLARVQLP